METMVLLLATIILLSLLIARPFVKGAYRIPVSNTVLGSQQETYQGTERDRICKSWKFDPHEVKILEQLLINYEKGISVNQLNELLNLKGKSAENQRQRRHLVIKELNTKLFVLFNIRECIVRIPELFDSRKKQYVMLINDDIHQSISDFLAQ